MHRVLVVLALFVLVGSATVAFVDVPPTTRAASGPMLYDDFTHDTSLNASLWVINGPVGSVMGPDDAGFNQVTLVPSFSSTGMEIAQVNKSQEEGTIESIASFTPPFTAVAVVEGTVSNGHTFGFAIASGDASSGVLVYGNLNPTNCSHLGDCSDPSVCGTPANSAIPANQCYYGIDVKVAKNATSWPHVAALYLTPSVNVFYTLQISVDASGSAQYSVSQGGQLLGQSTAQVGTGPFYVVMEQAEGAPVATPGPNQAYWSSVSVGPLVVTTSTTTTSPSTTAVSPAPTSSIPSDVWIILILLVVLLLLILLLWLRRRNLTVAVQDLQTLSPIPEAGVFADGPEKLSGYSGGGGKITFKSVKKGDYLIKASAAGYAPSIPVKLTVKKTTKCVVKLDRTTPVTQEGAGGTAPGPQPPQAPTEVAQPVQAAAPATTPPKSVPSPSVQQEPELEGWGGGRISEIIKTFQAKGAVSPETALTAQELGLSRLFVRIMKRRQGRTRVFIEINGRYYLDQKALEEMK